MPPATGSVARGLVLGGRRRRLLAFGTDAAHRPPQEIGLLVRLLEAIPSAGFPAALPTRFRLNFRGLRVALVRRRGTALHGAIAVAAVVAIAISIAMAEAALVAAERPVVAPAFKATLVARRLMMLRHRRMWRLEGFVEQILTLIVAELIADITRLAQPLAIAIGQLARLLQLLAVGHDDAVVVFRVLQIVFAEHRVAR
jgi:hypothetical protein